MPHHRTPRSLLTPAMHNVLDRMARAGKLPLHALSPAQARLAYEVGANVLEIDPGKVQRALALSANKYCSVSAMLAAGALITYTLHHGGQRYEGAFHETHGEG